MIDTPDLTTAAIKMAISLIVVLAMVWGLYRFARKMMPAGRAGNSGKFIRVVENHYLGLKKNLMMVHVPGALLVLGVTGERIELLAQLDDQEALSQIEPAIRQDPAVNASFKSQLRRLMRGKQMSSRLNANEQPLSGSPS